MEKTIRTMNQLINHSNELGSMVLLTSKSIK